MLVIPNHAETGTFSPFFIIPAARHALEADRRPAKSNRGIFKGAALLIVIIMIKRRVSTSFMEPTSFFARQTLYGKAFMRIL